MITHTLRLHKPVPFTVPFQLVQKQYGLLVPIGDVHFGTPGFPTTRLVEHLRWAYNRGALFLGMGEYLDFTTPTQREVLKGLRDSTTMTLDDYVRKQTEEFYQLIAFTRDRWIGMLQGHHFYTYKNATTTDQHLCQLLRCPFLGTQTLLWIRLAVNPPRGTSTRKSHISGNGADIIICAHHGAGGSTRRVGSGLLRLEDMAYDFPQADIILMGDNHSKVNAPMDVCYRTHAGHVYHKTRLLARTGGWLRGYLSSPPKSLKLPALESVGTYVEQRALHPAALGSPVFALGYKRLRFRETGRGQPTTDVSIYVADIHYAL